MKRNFTLSLAARAIFLLAMAMQLQETTALPLHVQISVCSMLFAGNVTSSERLQKN